MRSRCIAILPNAGLGNILFAWAHAHVFGALNGIPACAVGWSRPHIGPLLRGERQYRYYGNSLRQSLFEVAASGFLATRGKTIHNPPVQQVQDSLKSDHLFLWNQIPHWSNFFENLRTFRDLVRQLIWQNVKPAMRLEVLEAVPPVVAVHIRRGDFRELAPDQDFRRVGSTRTPLGYFVSTIEAIRRCHGSDVPVTVFTDGYPSELEPVLALPAVRIATPSKPIADLLLMSRAGLIITSAGSTFGYWAGFLANAPVLLHPDHLHAPLRPQTVNDIYFEGAAVGEPETWPELLIKNINNLRSA